MQIRIVNAGMDAMVRRRIQDVFEKSHALYKTCVNPELVNEIEAVHQSEHPRSEAKQHHRRVEHPVQSSRKPALSCGDAQVVVFARVVNDVKIPKQARFVADAMKE